MSFGDDLEIQEVSSEISLKDSFNEAEKGMLATKTLDQEFEQGGFDVEALERMRELKEFAHNEGLKIEDLQSSSVLLSGAAYTKLFQHIEEQRQKERNSDFILMVDTLTVLEDMYTDMSDILDKMKENQKQIEIGLEIWLAQDADAAREWLEEEYGIDTDGMSDQEALEQVRDKTSENIDKQEVYYQRLEKLANDYEEKLDGLSEEDKEIYQDKLKDIRAEMDDLNLDFDGVRAKLDKDKMTADTSSADTIKEGFALFREKEQAVSQGFDKDYETIDQVESSANISFSFDDLESAVNKEVEATTTLSLTDAFAALDAATTIETPETPKTSVVEDNTFASTAAISDPFNSLSMAVDAEDNTQKPEENDLTVSTSTNDLNNVTGV